MTGVPSLEHALGEVSRFGIAPLVRVHNSRPKSSRDYPRWAERKGEVETEVAQKLANLGAFVQFAGPIAQLRFAGVEARTSKGLLEALRIWRRRAQAKLGGPNR